MYVYARVKVSSCVRLKCRCCHSRVTMYNQQVTLSISVRHSRKVIWFICMSKIRPSFSTDARHISIVFLSVKMWSSAWARVPHPFLHLPHKPLLPGPAALLHRQQLWGAGLLLHNQGQASHASGLMDHPRRCRSWSPPQQGGHRGSQSGSQAEADLQAALNLRGCDHGKHVAREAAWAVQHQNGEGMPGGNGLLHDGDGFDTGGDSAPQPWREGPGAVLRGYSYRLGSKNSVQIYRVSAASAECNGETSSLFIH